MSDRPLEYWEACLQHLFASQLPPYRGEPATSIGAVVWGWRDSPFLSFATEEANDRLADVNLRVLYKVPGTETGGRFLAIPVTPQNALRLDRLFEGTPWQRGIWPVTLRQAPTTVIRSGGYSCKIGGLARRCLILDLMGYKTHLSEG